MTASGTTGRVAMCALLLACGSPAGAQTVDELVARHIAARGGLDRIKAVQTLRIARRVTTLGSSMDIVILKKRPNLYRSEVTPEGRPTNLRALGPAGLWEVQAGKLVRRPEPMAVELAELDADIDGPLVDYREKGHRVELAGRGVEAGTDVYKLKVTLRSGAERMIHLDARTFLERRHVGTLTLAPDRVAKVEIRYDDYRDVNGLLLPFAVDEERDVMGQNYSFYTDRIDVDVPIDDALFLPPSE